MGKSFDVFKVNTGAVDASSRADEVPKARWKELVAARRAFVQTDIPYDCRCLVQFVEEADLLWEPLGFTSAEELIANGYKLDPQAVRLAVSYLNRVEPEEPVTLQFAYESEAEAQRQRAIDLALNPPALNDNGTNRHTSKGTAVKGRGVEYYAAKIAKDHPDIHARMKAGEFKSVRQAAIAAGLVKPKEKRPAVSILLDAPPAEVAATLFEKWPDVEGLWAIVDALSDALPPRTPAPAVAPVAVPAVMPEAPQSMTFEEGAVMVLDVPPPPPPLPADRPRVRKVRTNETKADLAPNEVYIGRAFRRRFAQSEWANKYIVGKHGDRDQCCELYSKDLLSDAARVAEVKRKLRGKTLVCWCYPARCHGDLLLAIANED